jgi:uncharacterized protein (TIGR00369 family)
MKLKDMPPIDIEKYTFCFGCGKDNPIGLKLKPRQEGDGARCEFVASEHHQGWPGMVHGGVINTMLDEVMAYAAAYRGLHCATARMEVHFREGTPVGQTLHISARVAEVHARTIEVEGQIRDSDGTLLAESMSTMYILKDVNRK